MKIISLDMPVVMGENKRSSFTALLEVNGERQGIGMDDSHRSWREAKNAIDVYMNSEHSTEDNELLAKTLHDLVNITDKVQQKVTMVKDILDGRMVFDGHHITVDHDPIDPALEAHILRMLNEDGTPKSDLNWRSFAKFVEKLYTNYDVNVRKQLFGWLNYENIHGQGFTLTTDGNFIGYKGCDGTEENPTSINTGTAFVNGVQHTGKIPNPVGAVVEMPRSQVEANPEVGCSKGLHVGTYNYAEGWALGVLLTVEVDPRDVVSVPTECSAQKIRTCRYKVIDTTKIALNEATYVNDDWEDEEDWCHDCDEHKDDCVCEDECYDCGCSIDECECRSDKTTNVTRGEEPKENRENLNNVGAVSFDYTKQNGEVKHYCVKVTKDDPYYLYGEVVETGQPRTFIKDQIRNLKESVGTATQSEKLDTVGTPVKEDDIYRYSGEPLRNGDYSVPQSDVDEDSSDSVTEEKEERGTDKTSGDWRDLLNDAFGGVLPKHSRGSLNDVLSDAQEKIFDVLGGGVGTSAPRKNEKKEDKPREHDPLKDVWGIFDDIFGGGRD